MIFFSQPNSIQTHGNGRRLSAEYSDVELKRRGLAESDFRKLAVSRIQQEIPFSTNRCGWNEPRDRTAEPSRVPKLPQGLISPFAPATRKIFLVDPANLNSIRNLTLDCNQIDRPKIRLQIDECFHGSEGKRCRRIDNPHAITIPPPPVEASAFPICCFSDISPAADSPESHQLYTP